MDLAAQVVIAGAYDLVIAGGVEMMGLVPMRANRLGKDNLGPLLRQRYPDGFVHQGISAELIGARWNIPRKSQDIFAERSHRLAAQGEDAGSTAQDVAPVETPTGLVSRDEGLRRDTSVGRLRRVKASVHHPAMATRYPQLRWRVTSGDSKPLSDRRRRAV